MYFPGLASGINTTAGAPTVEILGAIDRLIGTFRDAVGPKVGLCLDLNYNFRTEGVLRIAKLLEKYDMQWVLREHPWLRPGDGGAPLLDGMDPGQMTKRPG